MARHSRHDVTNIEEVAERFSVQLGEDISQLQSSAVKERAKLDRLITSKNKLMQDISVVEQK